MLTLNVEGAGSSVLCGHWGNAYGVQRAVPAATLDNLVRDRAAPQPDFIKLDVQGYELEVLKGARETLPGVHAIVAEVSFYPFQQGMPLFHEVVGRLGEYGFVVADILSLSIRPLDGTAAQSDVLFIRATHPLRQDIRWDRTSLY
jgi:hypothetical protein